MTSYSAALKLSVHIRRATGIDMRLQMLLGTCCLGLLVACQTDVSAPPFQPGRNIRPANLTTAPASISLSADEQRLIAELTALYPGEHGELLGRAISDPFMVGVKTPQNHRAQAIIDQIDALRHARIDSIVRAESARRPAVVSATLVLVPQLSQPGASAIVWRRTHQVPHDVIVLQSDHATLGTLGAGVQALITMRKREGDSAIVDEHVVVRGERILKQWQGGTAALVLDDLDKLQKASPEQIPSFGAVRSRVIFFAGVGPRKQRP